MNRIIKLIILFGIGYLVYKYFKKEEPVGGKSNGDPLDPITPIAPTDPSRKDTSFCDNLLTNPRAAGYYSRKSLPVMTAYGNGQIELTPMPNATDLPYTFSVQNIATGKYYTHYHGTNPNGGRGSGQGGSNYTPTTKYKDLPAGDYEWSVRTASDCKQGTTLTIS